MLIPRGVIDNREVKKQGSKETVRGMAKQHYDTMRTEDICNLPVRICVQILLYCLCGLLFLI